MVKEKFTKGQFIATIYGDGAIIVSPGVGQELTKLDREICIGQYMDGYPCYGCFIVTDELYDITVKGVLVKEISHII